MASMEERATVTEMGNASALWWHRHDSSHQQLERLEQWGAGQCLPRQLCALSTTVCETPTPARGQGKNFAPTGMEEPLANVCTAEAPNAGLHLLGIFSPPGTLQPGHPHQQQHHGPGPRISSPRHCNRRPLGQQHQQIQDGIRMAIFPQTAGRVHGRTTSMAGRNHHNSGISANSPCNQASLQHQQQGSGVGLAVDTSSKGKKAAGSVCSGGLGNGGWGTCGKVVDGQMVAGSPKSSVSSDDSAETLVEKSPTVVWQADMRRGGSRAGGGDSSSSCRKRARLEAADTNPIALLQPQMIADHDGMGIHNVEQLFLCTSMELESARNGAGEESRNKEDDLNQLLQFVRITMLERDEARDQLQKLHAKIAAQRSSHDYSPTPPHHHGSALLPSLELPNLSKAHCGNSAPAQGAPLYEDDGPTPRGLISSGTDNCDPSSAVIDCLAVNKALPEKGKLLQAVLDAGPLLQTLLVAGALPRWRNPPPLHGIQVPPLSATLDQNAVLNQHFLVQRSPTTFHHRNPDSASRICVVPPSSAPSLGASGMRGAWMPSCAGSYLDTVGKRQKF